MADLGSDDSLADKLHAAVRHLYGADATLEGLARLSGGASQETWRFDARPAGGDAIPLILRRAPGGRAPEATDAPSQSLPLETEAAAIRLARGHGVTAPEVVHVATPEDGLGPAYIMSRMPGETIPRRILRDDAFAQARKKLAHQCGEALARLHAIPVAETADAVPDLPEIGAAEQLTLYRDIYDALGAKRPMMEIAFQWLDQWRTANLPDTSTAPRGLVHGDFRHGNILVTPDGLSGILDWELAHIGDPMEDLGWICVNSWRFGERDKPVGGFGTREELAAGYAAAGGEPDMERLRFWEIFGSLKWGVMCLIMADAYLSGRDPSVERAAIGRRASEAEIDLLTYFEEMAVHELEAGR